MLFLKSKFAREDGSDDFKLELMDSANLIENSFQKQKVNNVILQF